MLHLACHGQFRPDSGLTCQIAQPSWQRIPGHVVRPLAPTATPVLLEVDAPAQLAVTPAAAFGELLTE